MARLRYLLNNNGFALSFKASLQTNIQVLNISQMNSWLKSYVEIAYICKQVGSLTRYLHMHSTLAQQHMEFSACTKHWYENIV